MDLCTLQNNASSVCPKPTSLLAFPISGNSFTVLVSKAWNLSRILRPCHPLPLPPLYSPLSYAWQVLKPALWFLASSLHLLPNSVPHTELNTSEMLIPQSPMIPQFKTFHDSRMSKNRNQVPQPVRVWSVWPIETLDCHFPCLMMCSPIQTQVLSLLQYPLPTSS